MACPCSFTEIHIYMPLIFGLLNSYVQVHNWLRLPFWYIMHIFHNVERNTILPPSEINISISTNAPARSFRCEVEILSRWCKPMFNGAGESYLVWKIHGCVRSRMSRGGEGCSQIPKALASELARALHSGIIDPLQVACF